MNDQQFEVDGYAFRIDASGGSGAGFRLTIEAAPNNAKSPPLEIVSQLLHGANGWCSETRRIVPGVEARAWREGLRIHIEAVGDNQAIQSRIPLLKEELTRATRAEAATVGGPPT